MESRQAFALAGHGVCRLCRATLCIVVVAWFYSSTVVAQHMEMRGIKRADLGAVFRGELGTNDRATVSKYLAHTNLSYGHEWCAAFISWCFAQVGYTEPRTPWSPSLFPKSRRVWERSRAGPDPEILPGMVWGIHIAAKGRIGHVGFVNEERKGVITTVEGNTKAPDGKGSNGVYRKRRSLRTIQVIADWL